MPRYDYRCTSCAHTFEVTRPIGSTSEESCPHCGASGRRVFTPVGVVFKGSGFHNTDYRSAPAETAPTEKTSTATPEAGPSCGAGCSTCPVADS